MLTNWNPARMPEKDEMKLRLSTARKQLYDLQMKIKEHKIPVIVLFEGWGTSGKGSTIGKVIRNIDPRFFKVVTMSEPTDEELRYPFLYRFFKEIPEAGKFTFLDSGWLEQICREHLEGKTDEKEYLANEFCGSFEIVSLTGTVNTMNDEFYCHLHMSAGNDKGEVFGGHLNQAVVSATCEMVITVIDGAVDRYYDEQIGLNLFRF